MRSLLFVLIAFPIVCFGAETATLKSESIPLQTTHRPLTLNKVTDTEHGRVCYVATLDGNNSSPQMTCFPISKPSAP